MWRGIVAALLFISMFAGVCHAEMMSVSFSGADIRTAPTAAGSDVVFSAARYYPLNVITTEKEYYKVTDYLGRTGYVHKTLLKPLKSVVITASKANVRMGPGTNNSVVCQLTKGDGAKFLGRTEGWVEIKMAKGDQGWVADFLVHGE